MLYSSLVYIIRNLVWSTGRVGPTGTRGGVTLFKETLQYDSPVVFSSNDSLTTAAGTWLFTARLHCKQAYSVKIDPTIRNIQASTIYILLTSDFVLFPLQNGKSKLPYTWWCDAADSSLFRLTSPVTQTDAAFSFSFNLFQLQVVLWFLYLMLYTLHCVLFIVFVIV